MTPEQEKRLAECPFCGGSAQYVVEQQDNESANIGGHFIECQQCRACTRLWFPIKDDVTRLVVEAWNRREKEGELRATIEAQARELAEAHTELANAAMEINCAGPVSQRIKTMKLEYSAKIEEQAREMATLRQELENARDYSRRLVELRNAELDKERGLRRKILEVWDNIVWDLDEENDLSYCGHQDFHQLRDAIDNGREQAKEKSDAQG